MSATFYSGDYESETNDSESSADDLIDTTGNSLEKQNSLNGNLMPRYDNDKYIKDVDYYKIVLGDDSVLSATIKLGASKYSGNVARAYLVNEKGSTVGSIRNIVNSGTKGCRRFNKIVC